MDEKTDEQYEIRERQPRPEDEPSGWDDTNVDEDYDPLLEDNVPDDDPFQTPPIPFDVTQVQFDTIETPGGTFEEFGENLNEEFKEDLRRGKRETFNKFQLVKIITQSCFKKQSSSTTKGQKIYNKFVTKVRKYSTSLVGIHY